MGGAGTPGSVNTRDSADYSFSAMPAGRGAPSIIDQRVSGNYAVYRSSADTLSVDTRAGQTRLSSQPVIQAPGLITPINVPEKLYNIGAGLNFTHKIADRRLWGLRGGVGSASDVPFNSIHETTFNLGAQYQMPSRARNSWIFLLNYSNNRTYLNNIPIPGVEYVLREPFAGFNAVIGFPFIRANYRPDKDWSFTASLSGGSNASVEAARRLTGPAWLYLHYGRQPQQWLRIGRPTYDSRLVLTDSQVRLGVRSPLGHGYSLDGSIGRAFQRSFYESENTNSLRYSVPSDTLPNAWVMSLHLTKRWGGSGKGATPSGSMENEVQGAGTGNE